MPKRPFENRSEAAAYHEAGHAVMCHLMHLRLTSIRIDFDELYGGETAHENPFERERGSNTLGDRTRSQLEKVVMVCLAGPLAQAKYLARGDSDYGGAVDSETASALAMQFFRSKKTADAYVNFARTWVKQRFDEPPTWAAVERLAHALLAERKISGHRAEKIIGALRPHL